MLYRVFNTPIGKTRASYLEEEKEKDDDEAFLVKQKRFFHVYEILQTLRQCNFFFGLANTTLVETTTRFEVIIF